MLMIRTTLLVLLVIFAGQDCATAAPAARSGESWPTFVEDGAWCYYQDPRAVYVEGKYRRTYAQSVSSDGTLHISYYDHDTGDVVTRTLKENWTADDHNVGSILVLPDKRFIVFYTKHNRDKLYCRTSSAPESIDAWEDEVVIDNATRVTYNHPVYLSDEKRIYVFWRGSTSKPTFATSEDGVHWSKPREVIHERIKELSGIRPYVKVVSDGKSTIHLAFTDGHPRDEPQNSIYYAKYAHGKFTKADGTPIGDIDHLPISPSDSDVVYDGKPSSIRAWVHDIALDEAGNPVIVYTRLPKETDHRYHYARWDGQKWVDHEITPAGKWFPQTPAGQKETEPHYSGGICINSTNTNVVYLSREVDGTFEIERWETDDLGATWKSSPITAHSKNLNVRPLAVRGYTGPLDPVMWVNGRYVHFTNYHTSIRMTFPKRETKNQLYLKNQPAGASPG